jgi:hypothetical protein
MAQTQKIRHSRRIRLGNIRAGNPGDHFVHRVMHELLTEFGKYVGLRVLESGFQSRWSRSSSSLLWPLTYDLTHFIRVTHLPNDIAGTQIPDYPFVKVCFRGVLARNIAVYSGPDIEPR